MFFLKKERLESRDESLLAEVVSVVEVGDWSNSLSRLVDVIKVTGSFKVTRSSGGCCGGGV